MTAAAPISSTRSAIAAILAISAAATIFLVWLIYIHPAADTDHVRLGFLPAFDAVFNGMSAIALLIGYTFIRAKRIRAHRAAMLTAFGCSTLFLICYVLHHYLQGDVFYPAHAALHMVYLPLLASHIILATVALPVILTTFFFSLTGRIPQHRRIARWTFPLWLYVSITGVAVYVMLRLAQG